MSDLYGFVEEYLQEMFKQEAVLRQTERGQVIKLRHKESHRRYILRRMRDGGEVYLSLKGISCPHLPRIYEAAVCDGQVMVLEEYIGGDSLEFLLQNGPLTEKQTRDIARQLCDGLYVLHQRGIVHRDIKPENVLLEGDRAVLIDLDAARRTGEKRGQDTRVLGTVGYAPPEQFGLSNTDEHSDIYAMGILINEMLTGKHPSVMLAPGRWGRIVQRCTMVNPNKRYRDVAELKARL